MTMELSLLQAACYLDFDHGHRSGGAKDLWTTGCVDTIPGT
jgi:hypothetical protein